MSFMYPLIISFVLVFISELGDKTQLLVLSFSTKLKTIPILIGVALGSFFSHGIAILFGSSIGLLQNIFIHDFLEIVTFISFILIGIFTILPRKEEDTTDRKDGLLKKFSSFGINYILIIALSICIGEIGDKTFLASVGLGVQYPNLKTFLIIGAILGMVLSNLIAIFFGKFLSNKISEKLMKKISGILFLVFGIVGAINFISVEFLVYLF